MKKPYQEPISPYHPDLLVTDERSVFQSKAFVDKFFEGMKKGKDTNEKPQKD